MKWVAFCVSTKITRVRCQNGIFPETRLRGDNASKNSLTLMAILEHLGRSPATSFEVFALAIPSPAMLPSTLTLSSPEFTCLLAWDANEIESAVAIGIMERLLEMGCVYLCCWGQGCERCHDIMDEVIAGKVDSQGRRQDIVTTWHAEDSPDEALDFFLDLASPTECKPSQCGSALVLIIGCDPRLVLNPLRVKLESDSARSKSNT